MGDQAWDGLERPQLRQGLDLLLSRGLLLFIVRQMKTQVTHGPMKSVCLELRLLLNSESKLNKRTKETRCFLDVFIYFMFIPLVKLSEMEFFHPPPQKQGDGAVVSI